MSIKLGHFELLDQIGAGGMGTVFRAFDPSLNRKVAIKLLDEDLARDPKFVEDFLREAQTAAAISHPHIVPIYFVGEEDGQYYIVMELLTGRSLNAVTEDQPMPEQAAVKVAIDIAEALKAAYSNQMIHGDIKPQNIFVTEDNGAKLLDFGLAKLANVEVEQSDGVWGSAYYISPERVGQKAEDFRSDIYSLGATIFEAMVGRPPFEAGTNEDLAVKRLNEKPPLLRTLNPNISKRTERIVNKMLAKNPMLRYLDYDSLIADLRKAEAALDGKGGPSDDSTELLRATGHIPVVIKEKSPLTMILVASLSVVLAGGAVAILLMRNKTPEPAIAAAPTPLPQATPQPAATAAQPTPLPTPNGTKIWGFKFHNPDAKAVLIAGNFDYWHSEPMVSTGNGNWFIEKELPRTVVIEYQFIADGKRQPDPQKIGDAVVDENGFLKSVMVIPKVDPKPAPRRPRPPKPPPSPALPLVAPATPAPKKFSLEALAASPADWPKVIALTEVVVFPAIVDGRLVGQVQANPGTPVNLVNIASGQLVVEFNGARQNVPVNATDLVQRAEAASAGKFDIGGVPVFPRIQAGSFTSHSSEITLTDSPEGGQQLAHVHSGDYTSYDNVNISGATVAVFRVSWIRDPGATGNIEVHEGSATGPLLGTASVPDTHSWQKYATVTCPITGASGTQTIYLVYKGTDRQGSQQARLFSLLWFQFLDHL